MPDSIQAQLLKPSRENWSRHSRYDGKAKFFIDIHSRILAMNQGLIQNLEKVLNNSPEAANSHPILHETLVLGDGLIQFAHHHHHIEDDHYFPQFIQLEPKLEDAVRLLDGDHNALSVTLDDTERTLKQTTYAEKPYSSLGLLHERAIDLNKLISRHLLDEEEIIIPILLKY